MRQQIWLTGCRCSQTLRLQGLWSFWMSRQLICLRGFIVQLNSDGLCQREGCAMPFILKFRDSILRIRRLFLSFESRIKSQPFTPPNQPAMKFALDPDNRRACRKPLNQALQPYPNPTDETRGWRNCSIFMVWVRNK